LVLSTLAPSHSVWRCAAEQRLRGAITGTGACSKAAFALISGAGDNIKGVQRQGQSDPATNDTRQ